MINAAEAVGKSPGHVQVRTSFQVNRNEHIPGPHVCLEVSDTGCGMDSATMTRIFDPFFTTKFTGRGLGLAAVKGIIRSHKGVIKVQSSLGKGSEFHVSFPIASFEKSVSIEKVSKESARKGHGTILVVDDEEGLRALAKAVLELRGFEVHSAENGREAVQMLERNPELYSAILLDLTMPVMTGEQALAVFRNISPTVPVVVSSGFDETEALQHLNKAEVAGFLQKPYTAHQLSAKIHEVVHNSRRRREVRNT